MTRKDYELIAAALINSRDEIYAVAWNNNAIHAAYCRNMADRLAADNPRFDRARFLKACGVED